MKNLKNKLNKKGGFTLIEMLIVVAIIAILIAISIPLVSSALEKARVATDAANERSAKAEITIMYLAGGKVDTADFEVDQGYCYDADAGKLVSTAPTAYGKCTDHKNKFITLSIDKDGTVSIAWANTAPGDGDKVTAGSDLCSKEILS